MQRFFVSSLSLVVALALAVPAHAEAAVVRSGEAVSVAQDEIVPGDFYAVGGDVTISGIVQGDVYVMGGTLTINGSVEGDVFALGGTVAVHGAVADDLRALGGKVVVAEAVGGDVAVFGGSLATLSTAEVGGEVLFYGGAATIGGEVKGAVHARAEALSVDGRVGGIDAILSGELALSNAAYVAGDVSYESRHELVRTPETIIEGEVLKRDFTQTKARFDGVLPFLFMTLFAVLVLVFLIRDRLTRFIAGNIRKPIPAALVGFGILCLTPLAFGLLMASVLGLMVGALLLALYLGLIIFAAIVMHIVLGALIAKYTVKEYRVSWLFAFAGVIVVQTALLVPFVGPLAVFALFLVTLGMMGLSIFERFRS